MCDVILPVLAGVAALGLLGGLGGNCATCEPAQACTQVNGKTITIPQLAGQGTNVVYTSSHDQQAFAPQYAQAPYSGHSASHFAPPAYAPAPAPSYGAPSPAGYGAPAPGYGAPPAPAEAAVGAYIDPADGAAGVNVGGIGAGVDFSGPRSY